MAGRPVTTAIDPAVGRSPSYARRLHSLAKDAGEVFAWGEGQAGQLGQGVQRTRYTPLAVAALRGKYVTHVACGDQHSAAISGARA